MRLRGARFRGGDDILIAHVMILTHPEALFTIALFLGIPHCLHVCAEVGFCECESKAVIVYDVEFDETVDDFFHDGDPELLLESLRIFFESEVIV